jgi:hypothetical protein
MTLDEILAELATQAGDKTKAKTVAKSLKAKAPVLYQAIYGMGYGKGQREQDDGDPDDPESRAALKAKLAAAEAKVGEPEGKGGDKKGSADVEKLKADHAAELTRLKNEHKQALATERGKRLAGQVDTGLAKLEAMLTDPKGKARLKARAAKYVLADPELRKRLKVREKEGEEGLDVLDENGAPYSAKNLEEALGLLVDDLAGGFDPDDVQPGTGAGGGASADPGTGASDGYDPAKEGKAMAQATKGSDANKDLAFR